MKKTPAKRATKAKIKNSNLSAPSQWMLDWATGYPASSGEHVNEKTALGVGAYLACIKNISEDEAKLPLCLYKKLTPRGRERRDDHPVDRLIHDQPNEEMTAMTFRQTLTSHALGWHGGFAEIVRDGAGVPVELWPLDPACVQVMRETTEPRRLFYWVTPSPAFLQMTMPGVAMMPRDIFHVHGLGYNGVTGYILSRIAKDTVGNAMAAQTFNGSYFANGATSSGTIDVPEAMSQQALKNLRDSWAQRHQGAINQWRPVILEQGAKWSPTSNDPQKSQMVETLYQGVEEVARLFRMPPHKIGHLLRSTNNNIEQQALEYVQDCLLGWLVRWEQEIWRKLLLPREQNWYFAKHDCNMLMRGDSVARSAFYREGFNIGYLSPNDIREMEDLNPIEDGGDTYFVNAAMVPLDLAAEGEHIQPLQPPMTTAEAPPTEPPADGTPPKPGGTYQASAVAHKAELLLRVGALHEKAFSEAIAAILRVEIGKIRHAAKRDDFSQWAADFFEIGHKTGHDSCILNHLQPVWTALNASLEAACN